MKKIICLICLVTAMLSCKYSGIIEEKEFIVKQVNIAEPGYYKYKVIINEATLTKKLYTNYEYKVGDTVRYYREALWKH